MDRERPWCVVRRAADDEGYELRFGCDDTDTFFELVQDLKRRVEACDRRFDPHEKCWTVEACAWRELGGWLRACVDVDQRRFDGVDPDELLTERPRAQAPPPPPPRGVPTGATSPYDVLMLRPGAPPALVKAAYRILAQLHHPDRGGDHERMVALNRAFDALGKGAA